jgi:ABC-type multidrug transport system fused ATPase/permease subunit
MCMVGRDSTLFSGTVKDNIIYGFDPKEINMSAIATAAKTANAAGFISQLPQVCEL